jgi:hypothetical protein
VHDFSIDAMPLPAKLRVNRKEQNLFRRDDGMVRLMRGECQHRIDIRVFRIGGGAIRELCREPADSAFRIRSWSFGAVGLYSEYAPRRSHC